jgi:hypothetical protein
MQGQVCFDQEARPQVKSWPSEYIKHNVSGEGQEALTTRRPICDCHQEEKREASRSVFVCVSEERERAELRNQMSGGQRDEHWRSIFSGKRESLLSACAFDPH